MMRPSPALIVSCVALAVALGGTGYAITALPKNSVGAKQIKKDAVTGAKIKDGSVEARDLQPGVLAQAGAKGDTGATGAQGAAGPAGPSGITATASVAMVDNTTLTGSAAAMVRLDAAGDAALRQSTGRITVGAASTLVINAAATLWHSSGAGLNEATCFLTVDGIDIVGQADKYGTLFTWRSYGSGEISTIALTGSRAVAAGSHDVAVTCYQSGGAGVIQFIRGAITVMAATA